MATLEKLQASIDAQLKKLEQLKAQKLKIEARNRAKLKGQERKNDTRRKILLGAFVVEQMERAGKSLAAFHLEGQQFQAWLTRDDDRALFGAKPIAPPAQDQIPGQGPSV